MALFVYVVFFVQGPADPLRHSALDLALNVAGVDCFTRNLDGGVAEYFHLSRVRVDFTSTIWVAMAGPAPPGFTPARPTIGPPVGFCLAAICLKVRRNSGSDLCCSTPPENSTSSGCLLYTSDAADE